LSNFSL